MNRRGFFGAMLGGLTVAADPERLLWTPGKKLISIPSVSVYDGPYMLTPRVFAKLTLVNLSARLNLLNVQVVDGRQRIQRF